MQSIASYEKYELLLIGPEDEEYLAQVLELHNSTFPPQRHLNEELVKKRATNGFIIVATSGNVVEACISGLYASREHILRVANWAEVSTNGSFGYSDINSEVLLLMAVSSRTSAIKHPDQVIETEKPDVAIDIAQSYLEQGVDFVTRFHSKAKAGLEAGAKPIKLLKDGSPSDIASCGYVVIYEYPNLKDKTLEFTKGAKAGLLVTEAAFHYAKSIRKHTIMAFSRFGELNKYINQPEADERK